MQISASLFGLEESAKVSDASVERLANEMLDRYRKLLAQKENRFRHTGPPTLPSRDAGSITASEKRTNLRTEISPESEKL